MKRIIIIALQILTLMALPHKAFSQTVIEGKVFDSQNKTVSAYVTITPKGTNTILAFSDIDKGGYYKLTFKTDADSVAIAVNGMSINSKTIVVPNSSQKLDICVHEKDIKLKEVNVRAQKIQQHGDTLDYSVGSYLQQGDRVIGDVLRRMPGIEVTGNGRIKYNGKSISKFYVEDLDLLQGRYGIATNNINAQDVSMVQVLENHQPMKALQGKVQSHDVAINLKLKDSAKGTVAITSMLGGGYLQDGHWGIKPLPISEEQNIIGQNPMYSLELVGMYFGIQRQNMSLFKGNNTGDDVSKELIQHYSSTNDVRLSPFCPTGAIMPNDCGLPQKRTFDNRSNIATINHLEKLPKSTEIGVNISYYNDLIHREGHSESDIFASSDSRLITNESITSETKVNNLSVQGRYVRNASDGFAANILNFGTNWNSDDVDGKLSSQLSQYGSQPVNYGDCRVSQHFNRPQLSVSNAFTTFYNCGKHIFNLNFSVGYSQRPNTLSVSVDSVMQGTSTIYQQDIDSRNIASKFHTSYSLNFGSFRANYGVTANASLQGIETNLQGFDCGIYPSLNNMWYNTYELALSQEYKYSKRGFGLKMECPLRLYTQTLDDNIQDSHHGYTHLLVTPALSTSYELRNWSANVNANYYKTVGNPGGIYNGYIMNNYRSFQRSYVEHLSETDRLGAGAEIKFRSAMNAVFFTINGSYLHTRDNQIYGVTYQNASSVIQAVDQKTKADRYTIGFNCSKGFDWMLTTIRMFGGYGYSSSERLISGMIYPFHSQTVSGGAAGTITPISWLALVLSSGYSWNKSKSEISNAVSAKAIKSATQRLSMKVFASKNLVLGASVEDNYNNLTEKNRHIWFCDANSKLQLKNIDIELHLNNLFNQHLYTSVNYSGLDIYTQSSQLRPRNCVATIRLKLL